MTIGNDPWFVAADIANVLGLSNVTETMRVVLEPEQYRVVAKSNLNSIEGSFPNRGANVISESGLYKLVMRSDKPQAKRFQDWVTKDVLPAIRKDGGYIMGECL